MKRMAFGIVVAAMSAGTAMADGGYLSDAAYTKLPPEQRMYVVVGLSDMMERMADAIDNAEERAFQERAHRCIANFTGSQLRDFIDGYIAANPSTSPYGMASTYRAALNMNCPQ